MLILRCQCPSVCPSVCDGSALAHYSIIGFKPRIAVGVHAGAREGIIAGKSGGIISRYASRHC